MILADTRSRPVIAVTARDGRWTTAIADRTYTMSVSAAGFLPSTRKVEFDDARETILDRGGVALHGVVEDISGGPIGGATIRFLDDDTAALIAVVLVDETGHYTANPPALRLAATAEAEGYTTVKRWFDLGGSVIPPGNFQLSVGGTIRGTIVGPDGAPCRDAVVLAEVGSDYHRQRLETTATEAGEFEVAGLQPGDVWLQASGPGCATRDAKLVPLVAGGVVDGVAISAERAFTLSGLVVERGTRTTIAHARVRLDSQERTIRNGEVSTDVSGRYTIHGILPGRYEVDVTSAKHLVELVAVDVASDLQRDLELARGRLISGRVDPPTVARLELNYTSERAPRLAIGTTTKADGTFVIENAVDGALELAGRSTDGASFGQVTLAEQGDQHDVTIALKPFGDGVVAGIVVEESGKPVADAEISVWWPTHRFGETRKVWSSADGTFRFEHLPTREFGFQVEGRVPVDPELKVTPGDRTEVRIVVRDQGASIRGRVVDADGKPALDVEVTAMELIGGGAFYSPRAITDATGSFSLEHLRAGDYKIQAITPSGDGQAFATVRTGEAITITLARAGRLDLQVTHAGKPVSRFEVSCEFDTPVVRVDMPAFRSFSTSNGRADGTYRSNESYPLGRVTCHITADAGGVVAAIEIGKRAELVVAPWAKVRGVVADERAGSAVYIHTHAKPSTNPELDVLSHAFTDYAKIDATGRVVLDQVFPGAGWVAIYSADFRTLLATRWIDATAGQQIDLGTIAVD